MVARRDNKANGQGRAAAVPASPPDAIPERANPTRHPYLAPAAPTKAPVPKPKNGRYGTDDTAQQHGTPGHPSAYHGAATLSAHPKVSTA